MCLSDGDRQAWEALCRRCGECCFEKWIDETGRVQPTRVPCRFLDIHSRLCRIYHERTEVEFDCIRLTPEIVPTLDWMPSDCAYVNYLKKDDRRRRKAK
jgi:hypothetical protein